MKTCMQIVKSSVHYRDIQIVDHEHLVRTVDVVVPVVIVCQVVPFNLVDVDLRNPRVSIWNRYDHIVRVYTLWPEKNRREMLHTPSCIAGLPFLFMRLKLMQSVPHVPKFSSELCNQVLSLFCSSWFMCLHGKHKDVSLSGPSLFGYLTYSID